MTTTPDIVTAERSDSEALLQTVILAFASDPVARYWWPDAVSYIQGWPRFALAMGERGFESGNVLSTADRKAVSFWLPPGVDPDPAKLAALNLNSTPDDKALSAELRAGMARFYPTVPHWYLWLIGVDPAAQGTGLGSLLLQHRLDTIDERGEIAFLECSNPRNVPFYRRHGFEIAGETRVGDVPVIISMVRAPLRRG